MFQVVLSGELALRLVTSSRIYKNAQEGILRCPCCHITFLSTSNPVALQTHLSGHLAASSSPALASVDSSAKPSSHACVICPYKSTRRASVARHEKIHGSLAQRACEMCGFAGSIHQIELHTQKEHARYRCPDCGHLERWVHKHR